MNEQGESIVPEPLVIPMMMFGRFRQTKAKRDAEGKTIKDAKGRYILQKYWKVHDPLKGDPGVYPSVNHIYTRMAKGRQKLTKPAEDLADEWASLAKMWAKDNNWKPTDKKVVVELYAYFPNDNRTRDVSNAFKLLLDSLEGIIYVNDNLALPRTMDYQKVEEGEHPCFELIFYEKDKEHAVLQERYRKIS